MEKNNVTFFKTPSPKSSFYSPGNNPFDDILKKAVDAATMSEWSNRRSSLRFSGNVPDISRESLSFHELGATDFSRESFGILPPDCERGSFGFMDRSNSEFGRESLGILHINALRDSLSFRRESLGILNLTDIGRESLDCGRESLGILHVKSPDIKFGDEDKKIPEIILTTIDEDSDYICNPLDTAFLHSYSRKLSTASSINSSIAPSFNSCSLEGPSMIYASSIKSLEDKSDLLNKAFLGLDDYSNSGRGRSFNSSQLFSIRSRIQSLPVTVEEHFIPSDEEMEGRFSERKFWSTNRTMRTKTLGRRSFHRTLDFDDVNNDFHDSVFIEGHHIAEKIADGSILNDSSGSEIGILDCTPQPNWPDDLSFDEKGKDVKCNTETVFKTVDKMLPPPTQDNTNFKLKTSKTDSNSSSENNDVKANIGRSSQGSEKDDSKFIQNMSNITRDPEKCSVSHRSHSVSKDAKEILHNLSEILSCTHPSEQQKSEGQNLLSSLADILCENKSNTKPSSPNDSGHSSINEQCESPKKENIECFEVLDLRRKSNENISKRDSLNKSAILDLSLKLKPKESVVDQRLSQSFSSRKTIPLSVTKKNASALCLDINKNKTSVDSSVNSNDSRNSSNTSKLSIAGKLRPKSLSHNIKKGPMKAVIPIGDMKKRHSLAVTPERTEQKLSSTMQSKRTSTPISEPKLKPMAASTPTGRPINDRSPSLQKLKKIDVNPSPTRNRFGSPTSSLPRSLNMESRLLRRNSVSEIKKSEAISRTKRSNSVENETGLMSSLAKIRQNVVNSPHYQLKKQNLLKENNSNKSENKDKLDRSKGIPVGKTTNMNSKLKTPGKENMGK